MDSTLALPCMGRRDHQTRKHKSGVLQIFKKAGDRLLPANLPIFI